MLDGSGKVVKWYGTNTDPEERKRAEDALRDGEQSFGLIVDGIAGLVAIMTSAGEVEGVNRQALEYFGKRTELDLEWEAFEAALEGHASKAPVVMFYIFCTKGVSMSQKASAVKPAQQSEARPHQLGQEVFKTILSEDVDWKPFPAFPPSVRPAVVVGQPSEPGPYTIRVKAPRGAKLMPHRHPEDRVYTVISGVFYIGVGDEFDESNLEAYPPGAVIILPGNTHHFHWAKSGEYITQVTAMGPLGMEYLSAKDDPRNDKS